VFQVGVNVAGEAGALRLRATSSRITQPGFLAAYSPEHFQTPGADGEESAEVEEGDAEEVGLAAILEALKVCNIVGYYALKRGSFLSGMQQDVNLHGSQMHDCLLDNVPLNDFIPDGLMHSV
jgi:hypothetical protein